MRRVSAQKIFDSSGNTEIEVSGITTVYTKSFALFGSDGQGLHHRVTSDGIVNIRVELQVSPVLPAEEGSADTNFVEPDDFDDIATITDEYAHNPKFGPRVMPYGRLKLSGLTGNDTSSKYIAYIARQEEI